MTKNYLVKTRQQANWQGMHEKEALTKHRVNKYKTQTSGHKVRN